LGQGGDVIDFWRVARGFLSVKDALSDILRERPSLSGYIVPPEPQKTPESPITRSGGGIRWPADLRLPLEAECWELGRLRSLPAAAFDLAARLGCLKVATMRGVPVWILSDQSGIVAEARRFDGEKFTANSGKLFKAAALEGSNKSWYVGLQTTNPDYDRLKRILLVEGMPDYFAGLALAIESPINFRVAAILGGGIKRTHPEMISHFKDASVIILAHNDDPGEGSASQWAEIIKKMHPVKIGIQRLPIMSDDLNDFLVQNPSDGETLLKGFNNAARTEPIPDA
jgi:hypothetical protein